MQRWPAQPVKRGDDVLGGELEVGVGHDDQVVLGAAEAQRALAGRGAAGVHGLARPWCEPTKPTALMSGWSAIASTASCAAVDEC